MINKKYVKEKLWLLEDFCLINPDQRIIVEDTRKQFMRQVLMNCKSEADVDAIMHDILNDHISIERMMENEAKN